LARNVAAARRRLPDVPLLLENTAATLDWHEDELDEPDFYAAVVRATGCELLLDVGNLYANAVNAGRDPHVELARFPLDRVARLHVAGGTWADGFYFDTHADPIAPAVFSLLRDAIARIGSVPILLERDADFGPINALLAELSQLRAIVDAAAPRPASLPAARRRCCPATSWTTACSPTISGCWPKRCSARRRRPARRWLASALLHSPARGRSLPASASTTLCPI
jgi:uncharacterized protein (UPF0276 family)